MTSTGRVLVVSWEGGGNVPPALNLGTRLVGLGHQVRMLGWNLSAQRVSEAGLQLSSLSMPAVPSGTTLDDAWDDVVDPILHGERTVEEILTVARSFQPDVLVIDAMMGAAHVAAAQLGLPTAVLVHVLYEPFVNVWGDGLMHTSVRALLARADRVLVLTPPGLDSPADAPVNTTFVGPILAPTSGEATDLAEVVTDSGDPWVLVTLGTTEQRQSVALPVILEAVAALPVRVLLTLGGMLPVDSVAIPHNVTIRSFVPHELVLRHMSAVVCHAGLSTITTSLAYGVPLVCVPQGRDQPRNAERVEDCGVGRALATDATAAEIAAALSGVLTDAARAAASRFAVPDSGAHATDLVERLLPSSERTLYEKRLASRGQRSLVGGGG